MDIRETNRQWFTRFDRSRMILVVEHEDEDGNFGEIEIPAKFEVCSVCEGRGSHVNPSIDSHGLSAEDFDEDLDFRENYLSGVYDVPCSNCGGANVEPVVDEDRATPKEKAIVEEVMDAHYQSQRERAYEHRMGY